MGSGSGTASILALLDVSVAVNTIVHGILLAQQRKVGIGATVLQWFPSFIHDYFKLLLVCVGGGVGGENLNLRLMLCGEPPSYAFSLHLYNIYMKLLSKVIHEDGVHCHYCADDKPIVPLYPGLIK